MPNDPIQIESPTGAVTTVQRSSLPAHLRRGWKLAEPESVSHPAKSASKAEWVAHAVQMGVDEDEAQAATRDELADRFSE